MQTDGPFRAAAERFLDRRVERWVERQARDFVFVLVGHQFVEVLSDRLREDGGSADASAADPFDEVNVFPA